MSCGGNCACGAKNERGKQMAREAPKEGVALDSRGKCPCGKAKEECCHNKETLTGENDAIEEICAADSHACG